MMFGGESQVSCDAVCSSDGMRAEMRRSLAVDVLVRSSSDGGKHSQYRSLSLNGILPLLGSPWW
jgi:hypothetical protein